MSASWLGNRDFQRVQAGEVAPLSFDQERLWLFDRLFSSSLATDQPTVVRLRGGLNVAALSDAVRQIFVRHESLRTRFPTSDGIPGQVVDDPPADRLRVMDLTVIAPDQREDLLMRVLANEARRPFDLEAGPVFRVTLVRLGHRDHALVIGMHHLAADLWSMAIVGDDLAALYRGYTRGAPPGVPEPPFQQADHAIWQRERHGGRRAARNRQYWRQRLSGARALALPTDHPRPSRPNLTSFSARGRFDAELSDRLRKFSQAEGVTLYVALLAGWNTLLAGWSGAHDVVTVSVAAGRARPGMTHVVGMFTENLVLRCDLSGNPAFRALLVRVKDTVLDAFDHRETPFAHIVADFDPGRSLEPSPLRQVGFSLHNIPAPALAFPALEVGSVESGGEPTLERSEADAWLDVFDLGAGPLSIRLQMDNMLFEPATSERVIAWLASILTAGVEQPEVPISGLLAVEAGIGAARNHGALAIRASDPPRLVLGSTTEREIAGMYEVLLGVAGVNAGDNFFRLGGDSMSACRILNRIERRFGASPSLYEFMTRPAVADVAALIDARCGIRGILPKKG